MVVSTDEDAEADAALQSEAASETDGSTCGQASPLQDTIYSCLQCCPKGPFTFRSRHPQASTHRLSQSRCPAVAVSDGARLADRRRLA